MRYVPGCKCCGFVCTFVANGCTGAGVPGATITLTQGGATIATCTTGDGTGGSTLGQCKVTLAAGTYNLGVVGPAGWGFAAYSASITVAGSATRTVAMTADASHQCCGCCNNAVPVALSTTDGCGTHTMTYGYGGFTTWTAPNFDAGVPGYADPTSSGVCSPAGNAQFRYNLQCGGAPGGWTLNTSWGAIMCTDIGFQYAGGVAGGCPGSPNTLVSWQCLPFSLTFNLATICYFAGVGTASLANPCGGGTQVVTP